MLYVFDLDGTLIEGYMDAPEGERDYGRVEWLPGRLGALRRLTDAGHAVAIASNQGGIAFGFNTPDEWQAKCDRVRAALAAAGVPLASFRWCVHHPEATVEGFRDPTEAERRKPSGAMIREAIDKVNSTDPDKLADGVIMVGDRAEDQRAAIAAGVLFHWADDFFRAAESLQPAVTADAQG